MEWKADGALFFCDSNDDAGYSFKSITHPEALQGDAGSSKLNWPHDLLH